jgi:hypothetical protein
MALPYRGQAQRAADPATVLVNIQQHLTYQTPTDSVRYVAAALDQLRAGKPHTYLSYWEAYAQYHLALRAGKDRAAAAAALAKGLELLEGVPTKTAEHYALLSLLQGLNLEFANFLTVAFKAGAVRENAEKALALAPDNLRAHYARGICDYYTPKQYGGGKLAAEQFQRALVAPDRADPNPYAPTWGRADTYWYLAKTYQAAGQLELAHRYAAEGFAAYPTHARLRALAAKL